MGDEKKFNNNINISNIEGISHLSSSEPELSNELLSIMDDIIPSSSNADFINLRRRKKTKKTEPNIDYENYVPSLRPSLLSLFNAANPDSPISIFHDSEADPNYESKISDTLLTDPLILATDSSFSPREARPGCGRAGTAIRQVNRLEMKKAKQAKKAIQEKKPDNVVLNSQFVSSIKFYCADKPIILG